MSRHQSGLAATLLVLFGAVIVYAQPEHMPHFGEWLWQSKDAANVDPSGCPGVGKAGGPMCFDSDRREVICCATPTPGSGGSGSCTNQTLSRVDANTYAFSPTVTALESCRVDQTDQVIVTGTPGQNQVQLSGSLLEIGWFVNVGAVVICCGS